tara:strand:- start:265 stop:447 length:183 start_codon:yes stop_codon:yes gene_type:complete
MKTLIAFTDKERQSLVSLLEEHKDSIIYESNPTTKTRDDLDDHEKWELRFISSIQDKLNI